MSKFLLIIMFFLSLDLIAQVLPDSRSVNWSLAGLNDTSTVGFNVYNANNEGFFDDGTTANDAVFVDFLTNHTEPLILLFPAGDYVFNESIVMRSDLILRGDGAELTRFNFDLGGTGHCIEFKGTNSSITTELTALATKGENTLDVSNGNDFNDGDWIHLTQDDADLVTSSWGIGTVGQIMKINNIQNNTLEINSEFRMNYELSRSPAITSFSPIQNSGIECIQMNRSDNTAPEQSSVFFLERSVNCWVRGVESTTTTFSHLEARYCSNLMIANSYFHDAFEYGGGGRAYGVMLHFSSNECLVYHNTFEHLRHAMILQAGANGNVFAYNRSIDPFWDAGTFFPSNSAGDMVLHGNYPFANLFEQNDGQNMVIDNSHGANGPHNTFFRNRGSLFGIFFSDNTSPNQNFIGNEIPNTSSPYSLVNYTITGTGHFIHGNNNKGTIDPAGTDQLADETYYFTSGIPSEIPSSYFASIGVPNDLNSGTITTTVYANDGNYFTGSCNSEGYLDVTDLSQNNSPLIYPNPSNSSIKVSAIEHYPFDYEIRDNLGQLMKAGRLLNEDDKIDLQHLAAGLYSLKFSEHTLRLIIYE